MTLRKSLVYSLGTHAAILIAFLIAALFSLNEPSPAAQTLRIRLRASMSAGSRAAPRFTGAAPADSIRERRQPAGISSISDSSAVSSPEAPAPVTRYTEVLDNIPVSRLQTAPPAALPEVDPLGGIDVPHGTGRLTGPTAIQELFCLFPLFRLKNFLTVMNVCLKHLWKFLFRLREMLFRRKLFRPAPAMQEWTAI